MLTFIVATMLTLQCSEPVIISKKPLTEFDLWTLERAKKRCGEIYPNSPCVKVFHVVKPKTYRVICGR